MSKKRQTATPVAQKALDQGKKIARVVFKRRGNKSEIHLSEDELAAIAAVAWELGADSMKVSS